MRRPWPTGGGGLLRPIPQKSPNHGIASRAVVSRVSCQKAGFSSWYSAVSKHLAKLKNGILFWLKYFVFTVHVTRAELLSTNEVLLWLKVRYRRRNTNRLQWFESFTSLKGVSYCELLGHETVQTGWCVPTVRVTILPSCWALKNKLIQVWDKDGSRTWQ